MDKDVLSLALKYTAWALMLASSFVGLVSTIARLAKKNKYGDMAWHWCLRLMVPAGMALAAHGALDNLLKKSSVETTWMLVGLGAFFIFYPLNFKPQSGDSE